MQGQDSCGSIGHSGATTFLRGSFFLGKRAMPNKDKQPAAHKPVLLAAPALVPTPVPISGFGFPKDDVSCSLLCLNSGGFFVSWF